MAGKGNNREELVKKVAEEHGYEVLGKGWPDFLLYDIDRNQAILLEVKSCNGTGASLSKAQRRMHKVLKGIGLDVRTIQIGKKHKSGRKAMAKMFKPTDRFI